MLVSQGVWHTYEVQRVQHNLKCLFDFSVQCMAASCIGNVNNSANSVSTEELREHGLYSVALLKTLLYVCTKSLVVYP